MRKKSDTASATSGRTRERALSLHLERGVAHDRIFIKIGIGRFRPALHHRLDKEAERYEREEHPDDRGIRDSEQEECDHAAYDEGAMRSLRKLEEPERDEDANDAESQEIREVIG